MLRSSAGVEDPSSTPASFPLYYWQAAVQLNTVDRMSPGLITSMSTAPPQLILPEPVICRNDVFDPVSTLSWSLIFFGVFPPTVIVAPSRKPVPVSFTLNFPDAARFH